MTNTYTNTNILHVHKGTYKQISLQPDQRFMIYKFLVDMS